MRAELNPVKFRLQTARGHLDGVIKMVEDDRYCIDVLHQLSAVQGALDRVRREILEAHVRGCVPEMVGGGRLDDAVDELLAAVFGAAPTTRTAHHCDHGETAATVAAANV